MGDFGPVDDLEVFVGLGEGENFDAEGGEEEVGEADAAVGDEEESDGGEEGEGAPPEGELEAGSEGGGGEKDGEGGEGGSGEEEATALSGTREAEFLVGFGDVLGVGEHFLSYPLLVIRYQGEEDLGGIVCWGRGMFNV